MSARPNLYEIQGKGSIRKSIGNTVSTPRTLFFMPMGKEVHFYYKQDSFYGRFRKLARNFIPSI
jgi:hypothetical protein